jgi:hypothetical protein
VYGAGGAPRYLGREVLPELGRGGGGVRARPEPEVAEEVLVVHDVVVVVRLEVLGEDGDRVRWVERGASVCAEGVRCLCVWRAWCFEIWVERPLVAVG